MKIFIAIPAYRGIVCPPFVDALEATGEYFTEKGLDYQINVLPGCCYIQVARNILAQDFIESDCDKMLFLDDDISWNPEDAYKLVMKDKDVVAGVYPLKSDVEEYPAYFPTDSNRRAKIEDDLMEAVRIPGGFLAIKKEVFLKLQEAYPSHKYTEIQRGIKEPKPRDFCDFFPQGVNANKQWEGEDYGFCRLWVDIGGKIYVMPDVDFTHHASDKSWSGNLYQHFLKEMAREKENVPCESTED